MQIYSICVGKREGATKLEARGMFKGAKVTRGPDWEWKEQDNQPLMEGEVTEVTSWSDETNNDAVRVNWNKGPKEDIYRLGTNGKVTWENKLLLYYYYYFFIIIIITIIIIFYNLIQPQFETGSLRKLLQSKNPTQWIPNLYFYFLLTVG